MVAFTFYMVYTIYTRLGMTPTEKEYIMKKIEITKDLPIMYCPTIKAGTQFKVEKFNTRFVYVRYLNCELRLPRKDVKIIY